MTDTRTGEGAKAGAAGAEPARLSDEQLLDRAMKRLQRTGRIEYRGEYGAEITTFIPFVAWLKQQGHLDGRQVVTYSAMQPYYFFLDPGQLVEKDDQRVWVHPRKRDWPSNSTYTATLKPWLRPPDYRAHYAPRARRFARPTLFIQNKLTSEFNYGPLNFLPLFMLRHLLMEVGERFQIVFSRPGSIPVGSDYSKDANSFCDYPDLAVVRQFPDALILEEMAAREARPYNEVKLEVLAGAHLFLGVQGGGTHLLAAFGNSFLAVLHRRGDEYPHAYFDGAYKYLSRSPPQLFVARDDEELARAIATFATLDVKDGRVVQSKRATPAGEGAKSIST